jgi:hypothetical protein
MKYPRIDALDSNFMEIWASWYPDVPPVSFLLREACSDRWLRIHSLPESKRYPSTGREYAEILRRHNAVADWVLGESSPCAILLYAECSSPSTNYIGRLASLTDDSLPFVGRLPVTFWNEHDGVFDCPTCIFGGAVTWLRGAFDAFIMAASDERASGLFVELREGRVYAPYDGGADLFFPTILERDLARERFRPWLSSHTLGL